MIADRSPRKRLLFAFLLSLSLSPSEAWALPTEADRATARTLANEGQEAFDRGDYPTAAERFARADALYHAPTLLLGLARSQAAMGKLISAAETYNRIVSEGPPPKSSQTFLKAVEDAGKELEATEARIPRVIINTRGSADAVVTMDGLTIPHASLGVKRPVDPGRHVFRATAPGLTAEPLTFTLTEGVMQTVTLELKPIIEPPPPPVAEPSSSTQLTLGIATLGLGGAGIVLGGITGVLAIRKRQELEPRCDKVTSLCPASEQDALATFHTFTTLSTIGFITGGAALATGVVLLVTAPRAKPLPEASIVPRLGVGYIGVEGKF
jgi:hypothetical protein